YIIFVIFIFNFIFFFQAEDGIRDSSVTGVQTCALPISPHGYDHVETSSAARRNYCRTFLGFGQGSEFSAKTHDNEALRRDFSYRSEERRVGKECRSRWSKCN